MIFTRSQRSAERVFASVRRYLTRKLHLVANLENRRIVATEELKYLEFRLVGIGATLNVSEKSIHRFKHRIRHGDHGNVFSLCVSAPLRDSDFLV